jgi:hypothetical protein
VGVRARSIEGTPDEEENAALNALSDARLAARKERAMADMAYHWKRYAEAAALNIKLVNMGYARRLDADEREDDDE